MYSMIWIIGIIVWILIYGFYKIYKGCSAIDKKLTLLCEFRDKYIDLVNYYFENYNRYDQTASLDHENYVWLTKNVKKVQNFISSYEKMEYISPGRTYQVSNYQVVLNTIPKFRNGTVDRNEVDMVDDSLIRCIGHNEEILSQRKKLFYNPVQLFKIGFQNSMNFPLEILNLFGILGKNSINKISESIIYKIIVGLIALVGLIANWATILQGKQELITFWNHFFKTK